MDESVVLKKLYDLRCIEHKDRSYSDLSKDEVLNIVHDLFVVYEASWNWNLEEHPKRNFHILLRFDKELSFFSAYVQTTFKLTAGICEGFI